MHVFNLRFQNNENFRSEKGSSRVRSQVEKNPARYRTSHGGAFNCRKIILQTIAYTLMLIFSRPPEYCALWLSYLYTNYTLPIHKRSFNSMTSLLPSPCKDDSLKTKLFWRLCMTSEWGDRRIHKLVFAQINASQIKSKPGLSVNG